MRDTICVTFSKCTLFIMHNFFERYPNRPVLQAPKNEAVRHCEICLFCIPCWHRFCQFFVWLVSFILHRNLSQTNFFSLPPPPKPGLSKRTTATIYTIVICSFEMDGNFQWESWRTTKSMNSLQQHCKKDGIEY